MTQAAGARMVAAGKGGSIINIGSIYGMVSPVQDIYAYKEERTGIPFIKPVAYSAAKSGIYNLTRYCATYWGKKGIRVNTLNLPACGETPRMRHSSRILPPECQWAACPGRTSTTAP